MPRPAKFDRETAIGNAVQLFWQRGFSATSMKDLELALNMRPGSIYASFGSKEQLFGMALESYAEASLARLTEQVANKPSAIQALAGYLRGMADEQAEIPPAQACMLVKTLLELGHHASELGARAEALLQRMEATFADILQRDGIPRASAQRIASRLQVGIMGLRSYFQRDIGAAQKADLANALADDLLFWTQTYR
ncbi:MAG: TetR/AcrR family transcriptional regulator [Idiomarina sp.]